MNPSTCQKNPISVLNEYVVKHNSKIDYEFITKENGDFLCIIRNENLIIGQDQAKKKQVAKTKAAESAVSYLRLNLYNQNFEDQLEDYVKGLKKVGIFKLINKSPYIFEYHIDKLLIGSGSGKTEAIATEKCSEFALKRLKEIDKIKKESEYSEISDHTEQRNEKSCQVEKVYCKDPRIYGPKSSFDQKFLLYFEKKYVDLEIKQRECMEIKYFIDEVKSISTILNSEIYELGSLSLGILRNTKLILDFGLIQQGVNDQQMVIILETLQRARLNYLESKEKVLNISGCKLSMNVEMVENTMNSYTGLPYFKLSRGELTANLYIIGSKSNSSLAHYT